MLRPSSDNERYRLLSGWCDGALSDAEIHRLDELVRTDPEFRDFYVKYMDQHAVLASAVMPIGDVRLMVQCPAAACDEPNARGDVVRAESGWGLRDQRTGRLPRVSRAWRRWAVVAAALVLAGLFAWSAPLGRPRPAIVASPAVTGDPPSLALARGFAVVIQLEDAQWKPGLGQRPSEGDLLGAGRLVLQSGRMTLGLLSGVTLTLEGPADLELLSIDRVHCRRGKLRTRVPHGAEGFIVSTPGSAVVDLGTEFGLNVGDDGKARVMVFKGAAEAAVLSAAGAPVRSQRVAERRAFEIDPRSGQIERAEARPADFVVPSTLAPAPLELDASYRETVLSAGPWAYWRFEAIDKGLFASEVPDRPALRAFGPLKVVGASDHNRTVEFGPDDAEQSLTMDGLWEPRCDPGYAVELWVLPGRIGHAALASLIAPGPPTEDYKHLFLVELTASDRQSLVSPGVIRFLHRWPPGDSGGDNAFSARHYVPNRWHHIVAQSSGERLELYVDGVQSQPVTPQSAKASEPCRLFLGRLKPKPRPSGRVHSRAFVGSIDELAVYNRPLGALEVRRHYELGIAGGRRSESRAGLHGPRPLRAGPVVDSSIDASMSDRLNRRLWFAPAPGSWSFPRGFAGPAAGSNLAGDQPGAAARDG
jgi:Concanavalin A-like lectin/glucanases superfamily/FecR protein